jgi:hypothetical protein
MSQACVAGNASGRKTLIPDQQPGVPSPADFPAPVANLLHLLFVAVPMPPEPRIGANFNGLHAFRNCRWS